MRVATPTQMKRRGRWSLILGVLAATIAMAAVAYAADIQTDADLSTSLLSPTQVSVGSNAFTIKVWAVGNLNNANATGEAIIVNKYFMATNGTITPSANALDRTTLTFTKNVNYSQNPPCGSTQATSIQGCPNNPFSVAATLVVASGTPDNTSGTLTVANTGSTGLNADATPDTGAVQVDAPPSNTAPSLSVPADFSREGNTIGGANVTFSVSATDAEDNPDPTPTCSKSSGAFFPLGQTTVNCSVTDSGGLSDSKSFKVTVVDTTGPALSGVPSDMIVEATSSAGATASWAAPTASDTVDGSLSVTCVPASGSTFGFGDTTVKCSATDAHTNKTEQSFKVTVVDTTAPTLSGVPSDKVVYANSASGVAVSWPAPTATDTVDGTLSVTCTPASGSTFPLGDTTVKCSATDAHHNKTEQSFKITVHLLTVTFQAPIDGPSVLNNAKAGRVIPVKAEVFLDGTEVKAGLVSILVNGLSTCPSGTEDTLETYASVGGASGNQFVWDAAGDRWAYNLDTSANGMVAPKCYRGNVYIGGSPDASGKITGGNLAGYFLIKLSK
jgi:hypothetical protein